MNTCFILVAMNVLGLMANTLREGDDRDALDAAFDVLCRIMQERGLEPRDLASLDVHISNR